MSNFTRRGRRALLAAPILGLALLAAGCGGANKGDPNANSGGKAPSIPNLTSTGDRYAACMRAHGVANFPDPVVSQTAGGISVAIRVTPAITGMPSFQSAQKTCNSILPVVHNSGGPTESPQHTQDELDFARCMRAHGVNFPDPNAQGRLSLEMLSAAGVNLRSPAFASAGTACLPAAGGLISKAELQQVESGQTPTGGQSASAAPGQ